ncbi:MAG: alpha/beta hydrolase family protein [Terriglobales bacterium]
MRQRIFPPVFIGKFAVGIVVLFLTQFAAAQFESDMRTPYPADPRDTRFVSVKEDWTTPGLSSSSLKPAQPLVADISSNPEEYRVELVRLQWRFGDPIDLYVLKPAGVKKPPPILYLYSYPSETSIFRNPAWQKVATKDGFAAVGFMTALTGHRYHDRGVNEWFVSELQECLAVSAHDVQMVLNYLAERGDLDMDRVGVVGEGSGSSIAILASAVDSRIKVLDLLDPWGDWPTWMAKSPFIDEDERPNFLKPEYLKKIAPLEPVDWLPRIQAKKFRLQDATFHDETPASIHAKLRSVVPAGTTIVTYKTIKEYAAAVTDNKQMDWMYHELRALPEPGTTTTVAAEAGSAKTQNTGSKNR